MSMAVSTRRLIQSSLARFGYRISPVQPTQGHPTYGLDCLFPILKGFGFAPEHILDVGANRGNWTRTAIRYFPDAEYTLVEPQSDLEAHVADLVGRGYRIHWVNAGAGDKSGLLPFTVSNRDDSSSFALGTEEAQEAGLRRKMIEVRTLDEIVSDSGLTTPNMVKIDAEGFDLRVLAGAPNLLGKADIVFVEAAVRCPYENTVLRVIRNMWDKGYTLLDITDINRSPKFGVLWLTELAFLREGSLILRDVTSYE